ncbi:MULTISPECIES: hypothetical protein [unclassified Streptomyces]|jgi:hypothetical protein|uniref:hypothetical protein n=1 Tax=unclassified Streptomyces TaxID=2593676 RepID=UPI0033A56A39
MTPSGAGEPPAQQPFRPDEQAGADERAGAAEPRKGPLLRECVLPYTPRSGQVAAVYLYPNGGHSVLWPSRREDHDKPWFGGPRAVFEVILGRHVTAFDLALPAAGDAQSFKTRAEVQWEVDDPRLVVEKAVWDVREMLHGDLLYGLRQVSRRFRLTEAQRAEEAVQAELRAGRMDLGADLGLRTRVHVFIDLSDQVRDRVAERDDVAFAMEKDRAQAEADRRKDRYERERVAERAAQLEEVLRRGEEAEITHLMASNPDKVWEIRQAIRQEKREGQADYLHLFNRLLDAGMLERHDVGEQMYEVLRYLRDNSGRVTGRVTDRVLTSPDGGRPALSSRREETPEPRRPFWDEEPEDAAGPAPDDGHVYEPTRVQSSAERDRDGRPAAGSGGSRPSADFDDWGDE